jgi:hypothetical protein
MACIVVVIVIIIIIIILIDVSKEVNLTNQNLIQEEIKRRLNSGNACYHSVQNLLSSRQLSKNLKIRIY